MFKIDKFFASENSVVLLSTDTEYEDYLQHLKKEEEDLMKTVDELDDFFLNQS